MDPKLVMVLTDLGVGILFMAIAIPLIQARVPRNVWYGFRTPKTLSSDSIWYAANAYMGRHLFRCGRILAAGGILLWLFQARLAEGWVVGLSLLLLLVPLVVTLARSLRYLSSL